MGSGHVRQAGDAHHARKAQGASRLTPRPREAPRPQRGAPDKSSGPCARGAAEGPAFPLVVGRRSHAGGSSAPLRSAPRRGASRGWGVEGTTRQPAAGPAPASTVSHGSEPNQGMPEGVEQAQVRSPMGIPRCCGLRPHHLGFPIFSIHRRSSTLSRLSPASRSDRLGGLLPAGRARYTDPQPCQGESAEDGAVTADVVPPGNPAEVNMLTIAIEYCAV